MNFSETLVYSILLLLTEEVEVVSPKMNVWSSGCHCNVFLDIHMVRVSKEKPKSWFTSHVIFMAHAKQMSQNMR